MINRENIYWIGGSPCSGKSSIAELLCSAFGFAYYKCDDHLERYIKIGADQNIEIMKKYNTMNMDQTWLERHVEEQVEDEIAFYKEAFAIISNDIIKDFGNRDVVVEGAAILPELIKANHIHVKNYVCMVPTEDFQLENYKKREWVHDYLKPCSNPDLAFENWMARDIRFAERMLEKAKAYDMNYIVVDGSKSIEENYKEVLKAFDLNNKSVK